MVSYVAAPRSVVIVYHCFGGPCCLHLQGWSAWWTESGHRHKWLFVLLRAHYFLLSSVPPFSLFSWLTPFTRLLFGVFSSHTSYWPLPALQPTLHFPFSRTCSGHFPPTLSIDIHYNPPSPSPSSYSADITAHLIPLPWPPQNTVLRTIGNLRSCTASRALHLAFQIPNLCDCVTKICRKQAEVIHNRDNVNVQNIGKSETQHRKHKRLKLGGGWAYDRSSV